MSGWSHLACVIFWRVRISLNEMGMLINHMIIKALVIPRSRTLASIFPNLLLHSVVSERVTKLKFFCAVLDA